MTYLLFDSQQRSAYTAFYRLIDHSRAAALPKIFIKDLCPQLKCGYASLSETIPVQIATTAYEFCKVTNISHHFTHSSPVIGQKKNLC